MKPRECTERSGESDKKVKASQERKTRSQKKDQNRTVINTGATLFVRTNSETTRGAYFNEGELRAATVAGIYNLQF